jgi:hypothetical protein
MSPTLKDRVAGLRAEAKHFRELAAMKRRLIADLTARPIGSRDSIAVLKAQERVREYVKAAQERDALCASLRAQMGAAKPRVKATGDAA